MYQRNNTQDTVAFIIHYFTVDNDQIGRFLWSYVTMINMSKYQKQGTPVVNMYRLYLVECVVLCRLYQ